MKLRKFIPRILLLVVLFSSLSACKTVQFRQTYSEANALIHDVSQLPTQPFLKAHLKNGDVVVLYDTWQIDTSTKLVIGYGKHFNFNRHQISYGTQSVAIDSVALFETNQKLKKDHSHLITGITLLVVVNAIFADICISDPKACYGSCPTFYQNEDDNFHFADAEGFSNAILPSMEYADIDALKDPQINDGRFELTMKNEALETHCVRSVELLAVPLKKGQQAFQTQEDAFVICENSYVVSKAEDAMGDITQHINKHDRLERFSLADHENLNSREEIFLTFNHVHDQQNLGLNLVFRQTLMTTFLIYNAMAYMGDEVGDIFSKLEVEGQRNEMLKSGLKKVLGDIDVYVYNVAAGKWEFQGGFYETGPIAFNNQLMALKGITVGDKVEVKLVLNKGLWRLDYAALTNIQQSVQPTSLRPTEITVNDTLEVEALNRLNRPDQHLYSMPGDAFKMQFVMPDSNANYALFLRTQGYYLEWMRDYWLPEKNLIKLRRMFVAPERYLKREAKTYGAYESFMEQDFWNSKIDTKNFSYYEN